MKYGIEIVRFLMKWKPKKLEKHLETIITLTKRHLCIDYFILLIKKLISKVK